MDRNKLVLIFIATGLLMAQTPVTVRQGANSANVTPGGGLFVNISQVQGATPDPCFGTARSFFSISQTAGAKIITGVSAKKIYICSFSVVGADAENISVVEGT